MKPKTIVTALAAAATLVSLGMWVATGRHYYTKFEVVETVSAPVDPSDPLAAAGFYDGAKVERTVRRPEFHLGLLPTPKGVLDKNALSVLSLTAPAWLLAAGIHFLEVVRRRRRERLARG
ncbi:MAG: hypothetical protein D6718_09520 [Acidobacteria bacterium]|nr:MAG: hypothetical protein D6718_09520 [Acidobacteriota bacterium]